jgi:hypothetical protein
VGIDWSRVKAEQSAEVSVGVASHRQLASQRMISWQWPRGRFAACGSLRNSDLSSPTGHQPIGETWDEEVSLPSLESFNISDETSVLKVKLALAQAEVLFSKWCFSLPCPPTQGSMLVFLVCA